MIKIQQIKITVLSCLIATAMSCTTKIDNQAGVKLEDNTPSEKTTDYLEQWQKMKFGMFIHWGVYSIPAGVWEGQQIEKLGEQIMRHADIPIAEYEALAKEFNPVNFDADAIVRLAKQAGMKYIILTSKHHDGFAMFKSEVSDYNVVDFSAYNKDILKQLADACKSQGMKLGLYYSTPDWHFNGVDQERNPSDGKLSVFGKVSKENEDFQVAQLKELLTNYGEIIELFFDIGEPTIAQSKRFRDVVKEIQPNTLINGRVMNNQGDFITMPDNHLPDVPIYDVAWETPGTFYHTWGYKSWVKGIPLEEQIKKQVRNLSKITCMGGNYLLNIGPKSDGSVVQYETDVLQGVGVWMAQHEEAIFNTEVNPFKRLKWGYSSVKRHENKLYLHVFDWPENGQLKIPGLKNTIVKAYHLNDAEKTALNSVDDGADMLVEIGIHPTNENLSVVVLEYEGELKIVDPIIKTNKKGNILLKDSDAIKHGKYGVKSYRSIIKDDHRTWDVSVDENGTYEIQIIYKMKYDEKDFILKVADKELAFTLNGKAPEKTEVEEMFDGNETIKSGAEKSTGNYGKATVGTIQLKRGKQVITFKSGSEFEFKATQEEFHKQDRKYRGLNIDTRVIRLVKK